LLFEGSGEGREKGKGKRSRKITERQKEPKEQKERKDQKDQQTQTIANSERTKGSLTSTMQKHPDKDKEPTILGSKGEMSSRVRILPTHKKRRGLGRTAGEFLLKLACPESLLGKFSFI